MGWAAVTVGRTGFEHKVAVLTGGRLSASRSQSIEGLLAAARLAPVQ